MKIDTLQIYYDGFISQQNQGEFLRGMADYIEFVINDKDCKKIISDIPKTKQRFILENVDSEIIASKKVRLAKKDFQDIFENKNSDKPEDLSLNGNSFDLKTQKIFEIEQKIKDGQGTTLWEAWGKMCLAYLTIFKKDKALTNTKQRDEYDAFIFESNPELVREIEQLETYNKNKQHRLIALPPRILAEENYKPYAAKIHSYLLDELKEKIQSDGVTKVKTDTDNILPAEEEAVFTMTYNKKYRKIFINGCQVRKFNESENSRVFEDAYNNSNKFIEIKSSRRAQDFVNAFGFTKNAKNLFFPISAGKRLMLNNPIRKKDLMELGLENFTLDNLLKDIRENAGNWSGG